jgi:hypothetical protein
MVFMNLIVSCKGHKKSINGHWHEYMKGNFVACYYLNDSVVSVNKYTVGYTTRTEYQNGTVLLPVLTFPWTKDYKFEGDKIVVNDSIEWRRVPYNDSIFNQYLSAGLKIWVQPMELQRSKFDLEYDSGDVYIFIGRRKDRDDGVLAIQLNDVLTDGSDLRPFLSARHGGNEKRILVINADKKVSENTLKMVYDEAQQAGFLPENIYLTAINRNQFKIGLVRENNRYSK